MNLLSAPVPILQLNACGVATPTNPLPPCVMAPRNAAPAEVMRRAVEQVRQLWLVRPGQPSLAGSGGTGMVCAHQACSLQKE